MTEHIHVLSVLELKEEDLIRGRQTHGKFSRIPGKGAMIRSRRSYAPLIKQYLFKVGCVEELANEKVFINV